MTSRIKCLMIKFRALQTVLVMMLMATLAVMGCGSTGPSPSPEGQVFKKEVGGIIQQMQQSLAEATAKGDIAAINAALDSLSHIQLNASVLTAHIKWQSSITRVRY